ncbi:MAG: hypothetical protein KI792_14325 [Alphaproteobacteria bacterium]|nr:hypothetical protein [Alphaproteobacteria bacterium SS10]
MSDPAKTQKQAAGEPQPGDDILDEIEAASEDQAPPATPEEDGHYQKALEGFDPHLRDAQAVSLQGGVRVLRDLFPFQKPLFRTDGNIPANIGRYRIAKDDEGTAALLFAFDPDDLKETDLSKDVPAGRLERLHVVAARKEESPAHWAFPEIVRHQHQLQERALTNFTLYQTSTDVWRSDQVGYALYPVEGTKKGEAPKFNLWMFSNTENAGEFTEISTKGPKNLLEAGLTFGAKLGQFERGEAVKAMQSDFAERVRREAMGDDPVSIKEKGLRPIWLANRAWQKTKRYFRENKPHTIALDALVFTLGVIDGPIGWAKGQVKDFVGKIRDKVAETTSPLDVTDNLAQYKRTAPGFDALLRDVDPEAIKKFRLTDAVESEAVPVGEPVIEEIHEQFSHSRLLGAMVGSDGTIARIRKNGIVSLRHANGVKVDHAPDGQTTYVRYDKEAAVDGARHLRAREVALFSGDRVLKMTGIGEHAEVEPISGGQFLREVEAIQATHDAKAAQEAAAKDPTKRPSKGPVAEFTGDPKRPIRWRNRTKVAAEKALAGGTAPAPVEEPHPSSKTAAAADAANDKGRATPKMRGA